MKKPSISVLLVDDEPDILDFLSYNLEQDDYNVKMANNGQQAIDMLEDYKPDLIILDVMMPDYDGIDICNRIRENPDFDDTLVVFLSAKNESFTQVAALESGGDDFIQKPIKPSLFRSKVKSILRRHPRLRKVKEKQAVQKFGNLEIDYDQFKVKIGEKEIQLAKKEFELLNLLLSKPGKVFRRKEILNEVWGREVFVGDRTIDVHIRKLREKIGKKYIITLKGVGYKFDV